MVLEVFEVERNRVTHTKKAMRCGADAIEAMTKSKEERHFSA